MKPDTITPQQRALRDLALRQLEATQGTLSRCLAITNEQGDREAVCDALGSTANARQIMADWFGTEPDAG